MNKDELLRFVQVYSDRVDGKIRTSGADSETKRLVAEVAEETALLMASIIRKLVVEDF